MRRLRSTQQQMVVLLVGIALSLIAFSPMTAAETPTPCVPTPHIPADQDIQFGACLFRSTTAFGQQNPDHIFASCNGCHPDGGTDRGVHPVMITNRQGGTVIVFRKTLDLRNVSFNFPFGWDGRRGGATDRAALHAGIQAASTGAITSPLEMAGQPPTRDQLEALTAFLLSRSPTQPSAHEPPPPPPPLEQVALEQIARGRDVFFGNTPSTQGLKAKGTTCADCHPRPFFTDNKIQTNVLHPSAAFPLGPDAGAGFVETGQVGAFKTPSLHHSSPEIEPVFMHSGIFGTVSALFQFYETSLGFRMTDAERTGLHAWLNHCPKGPERAPASLPPTCFDADEE
jgi:cytochrome c peroxidase